MQWSGVHALVQQAKAGNEQAWQGLYALVQPYLLRLAQRQLGPGWPKQSVSDLLQGTWLRAWQGLEGFRGGENDEETGPLLRAWLSRTLKNVRLNDQRYADAARRKMPPGTQYLDAQAAGDSTSKAGRMEPVADEPTPSKNVRDDERRRLIEEALNKFADAKDREIIRLTFFEDLSLAQIAERLDLGYDNVRQRFHKSLKRLKPNLKGLQ